MATVPVRKKIGVKTDMRCIVVGASPEQAATIGFQPSELPHRLSGSFDYIHLFVTTQQEASTAFPRMKRHLRDGGMLWVSWPKGGRLSTDLNLRKIIATGYRHGLVESKTIGVDDTWSAIKFTFPKPGKQYRNSYGQLINKG